MNSSDTPKRTDEQTRPAGSNARSMHDNVETWEDCCVCEPEPRWQALAEELERESHADHSAQQREAASAPRQD